MGLQPPHKLFYSLHVVPFTMFHIGYLGSQVAFSGLVNSAFDHIDNLKHTPHPSIIKSVALLLTESYEK